MDFFDERYGLVSPTYKQDVNELVEQIKALKPRIDKLIKTGNECLERDIELEGRGLGGYMGYDTHQFIVDSRQPDLLGFVCENETQYRRNLSLPFNNLGINGCVYHFRTDGESVYFVHGRNENDVIDAYYKFGIGVIRKFLAKFDEFESEFYKYANKMLEKQPKSVENIIDDANKRATNETNDVIQMDGVELSL